MVHHGPIMDPARPLKVNYGSIMVHREPIMHPRLGRSWRRHGLSPIHLGSIMSHHGSIMPKHGSIMDPYWSIIEQALIQHGAIIVHHGPSSIHLVHWMVQHGSIMVYHGSTLEVWNHINCENTVFSLPNNIFQKRQCFSKFYARGFYEYLKKIVVFMVKRNLDNSLGNRVQIEDYVFFTLVFDPFKFYLWNRWENFSPTVFWTKSIEDEDHQEFTPRLQRAQRVVFIPFKKPTGKRLPTRFVV